MEVELIKDEVNGQEIILIGDPVANYIVAYQSTTADGTQLEFETIEKDGEILMQDTEGNQWNIFGEALSGPRMGERLLPTRSYMGYFFGWGGFYPNVEIY